MLVNRLQKEHLISMPILIFCVHTFMLNLMKSEKGKLTIYEKVQICPIFLQIFFNFSRLIASMLPSLPRKSSPVVSELSQRLNFIVESWVITCRIVVLYVIEQLTTIKSQMSRLKFFPLQLNVLFRQWMANFMDHWCLCLHWLPFFCFQWSLRDILL